MANEAGLNFMSVKGPELLDKVRINCSLWSTTEQSVSNLPLVRNHLL